jgi:hypothetical protein
LKIESIFSSVASVNFSGLTRYYIAENRNLLVAFEVLTTVVTESPSVWDITLCSHCKPTDVSEKYMSLFRARRMKKARNQHEECRN